MLHAEAPKCSFIQALALTASTLLGVALLAGGCHNAEAQPPVAVDLTKPVRWVVVSNDNKQYLNNGVVSVVANPPPDTVSFIDLSATPPKLAAEIEVPGSVIGPPLSVAVTPDETLALVCSAMKLDPMDATKTVPDDRVTLVDLTATPPQAIGTVTAGKGPSGLSISRDGKLALVANRAEGTISVFSIAGKVVTPVGKVVLSDPAKPEQKVQTAAVAISPDGKLALATNDEDNRLTLLGIEGTTVTVKRDFYAGMRPYAIDIARNGKFAIVGNVGKALGDFDTVSLIDLEANPPRVVDTVTVGLTPEGVKISPDSSIAVAILQNGTNKAADFPYRSDKGKLAVVRIDGKTLKKVAEADIGQWAQGAAFSSDSKQILVGAMVEKRVEIFSWNGSALTDTGVKIGLKGGPAAMRTAER
jgi:DNA-binding beta-propeller fold protein YncE